MRVIITGATGLLGRAVYTEFSKTEHEGIIDLRVIGTGFSRTADPLVKLDLTDFSAVETFIANHKPNVLIHCAAERRPDVAAKNEAATLQLNIESSRLLGKLSKKYGFHLIYISTDYVFDGTSPPYETTDKPNPLQFYGKSKYSGELAIQEENSSAIILRVPVLYGPVLFNGESAVNILIDTIQSKKPASMDHFQRRYPTNVLDVAKMLLSMTEHIESKSLQGVYHFSAKECMTKYDICSIQN
jgi:S-adenosylmethionine synthetase